MFEIKYDIILNDEEKPHIKLSDDYLDEPEHKFFVMEMCKHMIYNIIGDSKNLSDAAFNSLSSVGTTIATISSEMGDILKMRLSDEKKYEKIIGKEYDIQIKSLSDMYDLNYEGFIYDNRIFKRKIGLKVLVLEDFKIYELVGGIDNQNWNKI